MNRTKEKNDGKKRNIILILIVIILIMCLILIIIKGIYITEDNYDIEFYGPGEQLGPVHSNTSWQVTTKPKVIPEEDRHYVYDTYFSLQAPDGRMVVLDINTTDDGSEWYMIHDTKVLCSNCLVKYNNSEILIYIPYYDYIYGALPIYINRTADDGNSIDGYTLLLLDADDNIVGKVVLEE